MNNNHFTINYFIRPAKINGQGLIPIVARIIVQGITAELSTNKRIQLTQWDQSTQSVINHESADEMNTYLQTFKNQIDNAHSHLFIAKQEITIEKIKSMIFGEEVIKNYTLIAVTEEHNKHFEKLIGTKYSYGSYKNYKTTLSYLEEFIKMQYNRKDIPLKDINYKFCERYFHFLTSEKPCNNNGANKHIQRLKKIINYALKMGYINANTVASYSVNFTPFNRSKLTWEEINKLKKLKLDNPTLKNVLQVFLFQCYTGLSYSDVKKINRNHLIVGVDGKTWISMVRTKTKIVFSVPLLQPALKILSCYKQVNKEANEPIFPVLSNQKMNDNLKIIAGIAQVSTNLTSHVARHAFATTITLQEGVPIETVSRMLGHKSIRTTQVYATVTEQKISKDMAEVSRKYKR